MSDESTAGGIDRHPRVRNPFLKRVVDAVSWPILRLVTWGRRTRGRYLWLPVFGALMLLLVALSMLFVIRLNRMFAGLRSMDETAEPLVQAARQLEVETLSYVVNVRAFLEGFAPGRAMAASDAEAVTRRLSDYSNLAKSPRQQNLSARFEAGWRELSGACEKVMAAGHMTIQDSDRIAVLRQALERLLEDEMQPDAEAFHTARDAETLSHYESDNRLEVLEFSAGLVIILLGIAAVSAIVLGNHAALRESEERLRFALESTQTGAWELDIRKQTTRRSLEHDRVFGYAELLPEWTYETFLEHVVPEDRPAVDEKFRKAMTAQSAWSFECRIRRCDANLRWIWVAGKHFFDPVEGCYKAAGLVQDITGRKETEERLASSLRDLREI